jgi:prepilin-type N-terminal cleavage/methylation domain-containing protein
VTVTHAGAGPGRPPLLLRRAFTITEVIVVIAIVALILLLAWPAFTSALTKRDLTRTMNNGRELYLAAFAMETDGTAKSDAGRAWPGDYPTNSLTEYCDKLVRNQYISPADLQRILSGPGAACSATMSASPPLLLLSGKTALKIYKVRAGDPSNTIFAASSNYIYATPLDLNAVPFGDAGFVVVRKSGDAGVYKKAQATPEGFDNVEKFQSDIGSLPGAAKGTVTPGDGGNALTLPQFAPPQ